MKHFYQCEICGEKFDADKYTTFHVQQHENECRLNPKFKNYFLGEPPYVYQAKENYTKVRLCEEVLFEIHMALNNPRLDNHITFKQLYIKLSMDLQEALFNDDNKSFESFCSNYKNRIYDYNNR